MLVVRARKDTKKPTIWAGVQIARAMAGRGLLEALRTDLTQIAAESKKTPAIKLVRTTAARGRVSYGLKDAGRKGERKRRRDMGL